MKTVQTCSPIQNSQQGEPEVGQTHW